MALSEDLSTLASAHVSVDAGNRTGSGTIVAQAKRNTFVLTCAHVVELITKDSNDLSVTYREGKRFIKVQASVEALDLKHDLAIIRTAKKIKDRTPLPIATEEPDLYEEVYIMGAPNNYFGTACQGILTAKDGSNERKDDDNWQVTGLAAGGISGGTVTNIDCDLVSVMSAVARDGHLPVWNIGFSVPLKYVRRFVTRALRDRDHDLGKPSRCGEAKKMLKG